MFIIILLLSIIGLSSLIGEIKYEIGKKKKSKKIKYYFDEELFE